MRISAIETYLTTAAAWPWLFVKVTTDEGLYGWGESFLQMREESVRACVHELERQFLLGQDPTRIDFLWQRMYRHAFWRGGEVVLSAISAVEMALWDITGKAYGQPVYRLLGGAVRDHIPCYTHCHSAGQAQELVGQGWRALKTGPGAGPPDASQPPAGAARRAGAHLGELRAAVGQGVALMADAHGQFRPSTAIRVGRAMEPHGLLFYEEPVAPEDVAGLRTVRRARLRTRLATGERLFTKWGFREVLEQGLVDVIQPDVTHAGGLKELLKIAAIAEAYGVEVAPHNPNGPVGTAAAVHAAACMPNLLLLEYYAPSDARDHVQRDAVLRAVEGKIALPAAPGLGIDLDEDYIAAHPFEPKSYGPRFGADGSVVDI